MVTDVVTVASIITACTVIIGSIAKMYKVIKNIDDRFDSYEKQLKEDRMHIMKLALFNDRLPLQDRLQAGKTYLELGGNGSGKIMYNKLLKRMEEAIEHNFYSHGGAEDDEI